LERFGFIRYFPLIAAEVNNGSAFNPVSYINVYNSVTGAAVNTIDLDYNVKHPTFSPDGLQLAFAMATTGESDLYVDVLATGQLVQITTDDTYNESPAWCWGW
jgi:Tol biopolymer transport system component